MSPTASLSSSVDPAEYRITPSRSSSPSRDGVLPSFFKSKSVETPYYEYKLALNVNSSTFGLVKQNGFTLIFQVKSMPMQHMLTLHMFVRSPHTSPCRNGQRLQRWDDDHDGTITINTTDEEDSIRQSSCFCVFQYMSYCLPCVPYARLCTQQRQYFSAESGVNQTRYGICMHRTKSYSARSDLSFEVHPRPPVACDVSRSLVPLRRCY